MKNLALLLSLWFASGYAYAVCSSPISRTNNSANQVLTSTKYNLDLNTVYSKVNNLPGDCINDETITTDKIADGAITAEKIAAAVIANFIPVGTILPYAGTVAPNGFLLCNGQTVSRTTYSALYTAIGITFGSGNGSSTFHTPDLRGRFLRGVDGGAGRDPDRLTRTAMNTGANTGDQVGSVQDDAFASHQHFTVINSNSSTALSSSNYIAQQNLAIGASNANYSLNGTATAANMGLTSLTGSSESRSKNANVNFIIKY